MPYNLFVSPNLFRLATNFCLTLTPGVFPAQDLKRVFARFEPPVECLHHFSPREPFMWEFYIVTKSYHVLLHLFQSWLDRLLVKSWLLRRHRCHHSCWHLSFRWVKSHLIGLKISFCCKISGVFEVKLVQKTGPARSGPSANNSE